MKKQTKAILIGTGVAAAAAGAAAAFSYFLTKNLVNIAVDREQPQAILPKRTNKYSGSSKMDEINQLIDSSSKKLEAIPMEDIAIESSYDGEHLVGHYWKNENEKRILIAAHGWRSSWSRDFGVISDFWYKNGCSILFIEQRGQGNSGGDYMGFGLLERYDVLDWTKYVIANKSDTLPIYLCGISMGASTVLMAGGLELPENVHGIMADCGYTSPHAIWKHVVEDNLHMYYGLRGEIADEMCRKKINIGTKEYSCVDAMKVCKVPVAFVHGTDDKFVPVEMTFENYKACAAPKRLLVVPGADHGLSYLYDEKGYKNTVLDFWKDFD